MHARILPLLVALLVCVGCVGKRQQAQSLIDEGISASTTLETYYQGLGQKADLRYAMEKFTARLDGNQPTPEMLAEERSVRASLAARVQSAQKMKALYLRLGVTMKGGADPGLDQDIDELQNAISQVSTTSLQVNPAITVDPVQILQNLVSDIEISQRERRVEHQAPIAERTVERIADLFEKESPSFDLIQSRYLQTRQAYGRTLIERGLAVPGDLLKGPMEELGLRYVDTPISSVVANAVKAQIDDQTAKDLEETPKATQRVLATLRRLERAHEAFLPKGKTKPPRNKQSPSSK